MKQSVSILFFFLIFSSGCYAQQTDTLKNLMNNHLKLKGKKPVHSIQVYISKGDTVFSEAVGFVDGKQELADKDNQYKIASITKTMTSVVILQLQEEGKLKITDTITQYLKDVECVRLEELHYFNKLAYGNTITIQQLLQHRSGFVY